MEQQQQAALIRKLATLLGFEDGADDILAQLLTIESSADLLDYLTQLLGMEKLDAMRNFVKDVERYRRGVAISSDDDGGPRMREKPATQPLTVEDVSPATTLPPRNNAPKSKVEATNRPSDQLESQAATTNKKDDDNPTQQSLLPENKAAPPPKGKAKFDCGCFGTLHKALGNCLYCGRITCEREGYGFCPFCGYLVEEVKPSSGGDSSSSSDEAWKHKERLLRYDREFAQRTVILDDQADHYNKQTSMWSTEGEKEEAARLEKQRQDDIHKRKNMQLNLAL